MPQRVEHFNDGELIYIALDPAATIDHGDYVHPLIVVDYDVDDQPIGFSATGPMIDPALQAHRDHHRDIPKLIVELSQLGELQPA